MQLFIETNFVDIFFFAKNPFKVEKKTQISTDYGVCRL